MKVIDLLEKASEEGRTLFGLELLPPLKGDGREGIFNAIDNVMEFNPAYVNITFHREGLKKTEDAYGMPEYHVLRRRPGTVGIAAAIQRKYGIPSVPHLICGGLSKYEIEDFLIDMNFLEIENVLALQGDKRPNEYEFIPHPEGHEYAIDLVRQIEDMNNGVFIDGEARSGHRSDFCVGVAGYPETHYRAFCPEDDIRRLKQKVEAGAQYVVTQMFFDNAFYFRFVEDCRAAGIDVPIIPGLKPLVSERQLMGLAETFNITMPEDLVREVKIHAGDKTKVKEIGLEWTVAQVRELIAAGVPAVHFYTMSRTENIARVAAKIW